MNKLLQLINLLTINQRKQFSILFLIMLIFVILEIAVLNLIVVLLNFYSNTGENYTSIIYSFLNKFKYDLDIQSSIILSFTIIFFLKTLVNLFLNFYQGKILFFTKSELSLKLMKGYLKMPRVFHMRTNTSQLIRNVTIEIDNIINALLSSLIILLETTILVGLGLFLLFVNYKITLISFFSLGIFSLIISKINRRRSISLGKKRIQFVNKRLKNIIEAFTGSKTFAITGSINNIIQNFNVNNTQIAKIAHKNFFRNSLPRPLFELFTILIIIIFFYNSQQKGIELNSLIPTIGVFFAAVYRLIPSFTRIMSSAQNFQFNIQPVSSISSDFNKFQNIKQNDDKKLNFDKSLELKNVFFSYDGQIDKLIFKDLNLSIKKGSKIGIVGPSGSGKSTFLDLMMGILPTKKGEILIDGKNLIGREKGWQKNIGCVPQDVFIIDDSLKKNIAFGEENSEIDSQKLAKAISVSGLENFVENLESKENTVIGERGSRISGGQRQRIGIARAFYHDPEILILDEATNALDVLTEQKIINEIFLNDKKKTIVLCTHNHKNLKNCDFIYEIKDRTFFKIK